MHVHAYLNFPGTCEEALKFYEKALGGKIEGLLRHGGTPMEAHVPANWANKVMHGVITIQGTEVFASDAPEGYYRAPQGFSMSIQAKTAAEAEGYYKALSEGGTVTMPLQQTFWAERFGMCTDRFGIPWMVNCQKAGMTPAAKKKFMTLWRPASPSAMPDQQVIEKMIKLVGEMNAKGAMILNGGWDPRSPCTTVKSTGGKVTVTDGPFAEAKEVISGFCMMQTENKEEAVEWARRFMAIVGDGTTEMRELGGPGGPNCGK